MQKLFIFGSLIEKSVARYACLIGLVLLYIVWTGFIVRAGKGFDFYAYYLGAYSFVQDINVYTQNEVGRGWWDDLATQLDLAEGTYAFPYRYPPLTAILIIPLLGFSPAQAFAIWSVLSWIIGLAAIWVFDAALPRQTSLPWLVLGFSLPVLTTLYSGQVNTFLLLGFALVLFGLVKERPWLIGAGVAFGSMIKVFPIVLLGYLLWRRAWKALLAAIFLLGLMSLLSLFVVSFDTMLSMPKYILESGGGLPSSDVENQSVGALIYRVFLYYGNPAPAMIVFNLVRLAVLASGLWLFKGSSMSTDQVRLEYSYFMLMMIVLLPLVWYHYLALLVVPMGLLAFYYYQAQQWAGLLMVGASSLIISLHGAIWKNLAPYPVLNSLPAILTLVLLVLAGLQLRSALVNASNSSHPFA